MLEFIVLGRIPGTNVFINFTEALTIWALLLVTLHGYIKYHHYQKQLEAAEHSAAHLAIVTAPKRVTRKRRI